MDSVRVRDPERTRSRCLFCGSDKELPDAALVAAAEPAVCTHLKHNIVVGVSRMKDDDGQCSTTCSTTLLDANWIILVGAVAMPQNINCGEEMLTDVHLNSKIGETSHGWLQIQSVSIV